MAESAYTRFLRDPDQVSRRAELAAFCGPRAEKFLRTYDLQAEAAQRPAGSPVRFNFFTRNYIWPAFFLGPVWFFYRRMWGWALGITALIVGLSFVPVLRNAGVPIGVGLGGGAALLYLGHAVSRIEALRAKAGGQPLDPAQLAAAGGVSSTAGWIAGLVYLALAVLSVYGAVQNAPPATSSGSPSASRPADAPQPQ